MQLQLVRTKDYLFAESQHFSCLLLATCLQISNQLIPHSNCKVQIQNKGFAFQHSLENKVATRLCPGPFNYNILPQN